jgi:phytoene dehydrogenase-like protein
VVIGAGVGGLLTACLLAREGLRVLLMEQHYMVGGYCSTFRRGGFTFDAATHFYPVLGNPETRLGRLLRELGVATEWVAMDPVDTFHFPDGSSFAVPADFDAYRRRLDEEFPAERESLERFFADVRSIYLHGALAFFRQRTTPVFDHWSSRTLWQELVSRFRDPRLRLLLTADCPHWGSPPERISFVFDSMLRMTYFLGNYYPKGSSQHFADELARVLESFGGEILTSTAARRIEVRDGRAVAVEAETLRGSLAGRHRVEAGVVVSNADWSVTFDELLGHEPVAREWGRAGRGLRRSHPCYLVHVGLEGADPRRLEEVQGYYWQDWDPNRMAEGSLLCKVFVPTAYDPDLAGGPGRQIVILQKVLAVDWSAIEDWQRHKAGIEALGLEHLSSLVPGIRERIVTVQTASARTSWRFTRNREGAMLGWEMSPDQVGDGRPGTRGPIASLFLVGHWVQPGGGIVPVLESARRVAREVLADREGFA